METVRCDDDSEDQCPNGVVGGNERKHKEQDMHDHNRRFVTDGNVVAKRKTEVYFSNAATPGGNLLNNNCASRIRTYEEEENSEEWNPCAGVSER